MLKTNERTRTHLSLLPDAQNGHVFLEKQRGVFVESKKVKNEKLFCFFFPKKIDVPEDRKRFGKSLNPLYKRLQI